MKSTIKITGNAGGRFNGRADFTGAYHAVRIYDDGSRDVGFMFKRKWLVDRAAFDYSPSMGWAHEFWFKWKFEMVHVDIDTADGGNVSLGPFASEFEAKAAFNSWQQMNDWLYVTYVGQAADGQSHDIGSFKND